MATRRFQPTNRAGVKRTERVIMLFTPEELEWITLQAEKRGMTIHNFVRLALQKLAPLR